MQTSSVILLCNKLANLRIKFLVYENGMPIHDLDAAADITRIFLIEDGKEIGEKTAQKNIITELVNNGMSIYAFELFYYFNVQEIIRIGTCGVVTKDIKVPELILANDVYSLSNFAYNYNSYDKNIVYPSKELNDKVIATAKEQGKNIHVGTVLTCDVFGPYINMDNVLKRIPGNIKPIAEEMEAYALVHVANSFNRKATAIVTAVDSKFSDDVLSIEDREKSLDNMITLALDAIIKE